MSLWNRAPSWPTSAGSNPWNGPPTDPAISAPASQDAYQDGQYLPLISPVDTQREADQIRSDAYVPPYTAAGDLDDYGRETDEMRRAYRDLHRKEPAVRSAVDGKAAAVAALDVIVKPRNKELPNDRAAAAWVKDCVEDTPHGWDGMILNILRAAFIDGFSVNEKTGQGVHSDQGARWGLKHVKNKDTAHLKLRLDPFRNVLGVVNTLRGLRTHDPRKVILFTHSDMFDNPFGQSDLRAAYRSANLINDAYQVWYIAIKVYGGPFLSGKVKDDVRRKQMETALRAARAAGFIVCNAEDEIEILNLASATSFDAFEKKVRIHREEIYLAVRHAYMPFMQSSSGGADQRGDTGVSKHAGSDPVEYLLAKAVGRCLTHQLAADLVIPNFPAGTGIPIVMLGGVNWAETKTQLEVAEKLLTVFGLHSSAEHLYEITQMPPPESAADTPPGPKQPGAIAGAPGAVAPGQIPADPNAAPTPADPALAPAPTPAMPATPFSADAVHRFADYFAASQHGHYPGDMHSQFGMAEPAFADATKLRRKQVRRGGETAWVWAAPPQVPPGVPPLIPPSPTTFSAGHKAPLDVLADELIAEFGRGAA